MQAFSEAQHAYVDGQLDQESMVRCAATLAREARRRRLPPETMLFAMELAGCYRSERVREDRDRSTLYFTTLASLLSSYYDSAARPADRRITHRETKPAVADPAEG